MGWSDRHLPIQLGQHLPGFSLSVLVNHSGSWLGGTSAFDLLLSKFAKLHLSYQLGSQGRNCLLHFSRHDLGILHLFSFPTEVLLDLIPEREPGAFFIADGCSASKLHPSYPDTVILSLWCCLQWYSMESPCVCAFSGFLPSSLQSTLFFFFCSI